MPSPVSLLSLFPATREQVIESRTRSFEQWNRGFTFEEYLKRDEIMDSHEHAIDQKLVTWVLAPRDNPQTLDFMSSCETFRRAAVTVKSAPGGIHQVEEVVGYGIASVFTPSSKRGKGYARHMMRLLHWVLAPRSSLTAQFPPEWGAPPEALTMTGDAQFSVLYSDIGPSFYHESGPVSTDEGWVTRSASGTIWNVNSTTSEQPAKTSGTWKWLSKEDTRAVWETDVQLMKADVLKAASQVGTLFTFLPNNGVGLFNIQRTMAFTPDLRPVLPTDTWGVLLTRDGDQEESLTFATWMLDIKMPPHTLVVTRLRTNKETFLELLSILLEAARRHKVERVEIWNLPMELGIIAEELGGKTSERDEHLSSFKWYGPERNDQVQWMFNEKFCWC